MSAVAVATSGRGWEDAGRGDRGAEGAADAGPAQPRLFALPGGAVEEVPAPTQLRGPAPAPALRTLDDVLADAWSAASAGVTTACPVCSGPLRPRWSAGSGAVGGRCGDCGTRLE